MKPTTYSDAGVDIDRGEEFIEAVKQRAICTTTPGVVSGIGGFNGAFELPAGYKQPVLLASADGVGTKVLMANTRGHRYGLGFDLAGMVVNDLICSGAKPLFFLDYYATGEVDTEFMIPVIEGLCDALRACDMALLGGETAEMPGVYSANRFDIAGFGVGVVDKDKIINGHENVREGDVLIGIASTGPHSNGYSLIRKIFSSYLDANETTMDVNEYERVFNATMEPTQLYSSAVMRILEHVPVQAIANITGGGLLENLPRVVDKHWRVVIDPASWATPEVFWWLQRNGNVPIAEMYRVFNMGIGMVLIVKPDYVEPARTILDEDGISNYQIGEVLMYEPGEPPVLLA